jgi:PAS domain S-box-containing protein
MGGDSHMRHPPRSDRPDLLGSMLPETVVELLDRITDGMFVFDDEWCFRYVNEPAAQMLGRPRRELVGGHAWTLFPEAVGGPSYTAYMRAR